MSSVMELNPTLQTVHTAPATTVGTMKMLESDVPVSIITLCVPHFQFLTFAMQKIND